MKIKPINGAKCSIVGIVGTGEYRDKQFEIKIDKHSHECEVKIDGRVVELLQEVCIIMTVDQPTTILLEGLSG